MKTITETHAVAKEERDAPISRVEPPLETDRTAPDSDLTELTGVDRVKVEAIAADIEELIKSAPDEVSRQALRDLAMVVGEHTEVSWSPEKETQEAAEMVARLGEGGGKFGTGPENIKNLLDALRTKRDDPVIAQKLLDTLLSSRDGNYYAAKVLQGTTHRPTIDALKEALSEAVKDENWHDRDRKYISLPIALKGSADPEVYELMLRAFETSHGSMVDNFRSQAAEALGSLKSPEGERKLLDSIYSRYGSWQVRRGVSKGLKEGFNDEIHRELRPLIEGSIWKTASEIASHRRTSTIGRTVETLSLVLNHREYLHNVRVQVCHVLVDAEPELVRAAAKSALGSGKGLLSANCEYFAAGDCEDLLKRLGAP